jgi:hypothetical protein
MVGRAEACPTVYRLTAFRRAPKRTLRLSPLLYAIRGTIDEGREARAKSSIVHHVSSIVDYLSAAWAAANRAMGTRNGEHET